MISKYAKKVLIKKNIYAVFNSFIMDVLFMEKDKVEDLFNSKYDAFSEKELTNEEEQLVSTVVDRMINDDSKDLIELMQECKISNSIIMLTMFGIGTHTEYYRVLYNRINNNRDKVNDDWIKKEASDIFHEIDRNEENE